MPPQSGWSFMLMILSQPAENPFLIDFPGLYVTVCCTHAMFSVLLTANSIHLLSPVLPVVSDLITNFHWLHQPA